LPIIRFAYLAQTGNSGDMNNRLPTQTLDCCRSSARVPHRSAIMRIADQSYVRWVLDDPEYKRRNSLFMARGIPAAQWLPRSVICAALFRGAAADMGRLLARRGWANRLPPGPTIR
ncbi:MAG TPA: hypothetical protein VLA19_12355, partial [Herpetosiphonaceae bacterium]|nr:hypothetical protein [Herpetosiphonaceae bacterium]